MSKARTRMNVSANSNKRYSSDSDLRFPFKLAGHLTCSRAPALSRRGLWFRARWLLLLLFPIGFFSTAHQDGDFVFSLVAFVSLAFLLAFTRERTLIGVPIGIITAVFLVGYFLQYYLFNSHMAYTLARSFPARGGIPLSPHLLVVAMAHSTAAFGLFCLVSCIALALENRRKRVNNQLVSPHAVSDKRRLTRVSSCLLITTALLAIGLSYWQWETGVGVMGHNTGLPYHLAGVIVYSQKLLVPMLLYFVIWLSDSINNRFLLRQALVLLLLHAVTVTILCGSRGQILVHFLPVAVLWTISQTFTKSRFVLILGVVFVVIIAKPYLTLLREKRCAEPARQDLVDAVIASLAEHPPRAESETVLGMGLVMRLGGLGGLLVSLDYDRWDGKRDEGVCRRWNDFREGAYTADVCGLGDRRGTHATAPGLLGAFFYLGGTVGVMIGIVVFTVGALSAWTLAWKWLPRVRLIALPLLAMQILNIASEGTLMGIPLRAGLLAGLFGSLEYFLSLARYRGHTSVQFTETHVLHKE